MLNIIFAIIIIAFFFKTRLLGNGDLFFDRDTTASMRGVAMLGIILHHLQNKIGYSSFVIAQLGYLSTGLFFFISGYGNMMSISKQKNIDLKWLLKKLKKIYVPFFVVYCFYYLSDVVLYPSIVPTFFDTIKDLIIISLPNEILWFPKIIVLCFLLLWIFKKVFTSGIMQLLSVSMVLTCYVLSLHELGWESYWYNSVLCYPLGMLFAINKENITETFNSISKKCVYLICTVLIFIIVCLVRKHMQEVEMLAALLFSLICFEFTTTFQAKTKFLSWIGNNSFEFFLIHIALIQVFSGLIQCNKLLYSICVIAGSSAFVYVYLLIKRITKNTPIGTKTIQ